VSTSVEKVKSLIYAGFLYVEKCMEQVWVKSVGFARSRMHFSCRYQGSFQRGRLRSYPRDGQRSTRLARRTSWFESEHMLAVSH
jgi:hypothetical protein